MGSVRSNENEEISRCTFLLIRLSFASFLGATKGPARLAPGALNWNSFNFLVRWLVFRAEVEVVERQG